jgi:hypothetical protein
MKQAIVIITIAILALLVIEFNQRTAELNRLKAENVIVNAKYNSRLETKSALEAQLAYATSEAAVIQWAHEDGHMVRAGEIQVVPIQNQKITPTATPTPSRIIATTKKFENWLFIFISPHIP